MFHMTSTLIFRYVFHTVTDGINISLPGFVLGDNNYGKQAGIIFNKTVPDKCCGACRGVSKGITA